MAVALLLAVVPASAFAGGAGDDQYQDPLVAPSAPKKKQKAASTAPSSTTPAAATAPATTTPTATAPSSPSAAPAQELPRTGAPADLIGLAGAGLIASGAVLRRRIASQ
jgi:LPXTG-motif cell wall-anchored protein